MRKSIKIQNLKCGGCAFHYADEAAIILVVQKLAAIGSELTIT